MSKIVDIIDNYLNTVTVFELEIVRSGLPIDISRGTVWLSIYDSEGNQFLRKPFVSFKDAANGLLDVVITAAENSARGSYNYYAIFVDSDGAAWITNTGKYVIVPTEGGPFTLKSTTTTTTTTTSSSTSSSTTTTTAP